MAKRKTKKPATTTVVQSAKKSTGSGLFFTPDFWQQHWLQAALLMLTAFLLYAKSLQFGYVLDDTIVITDNSFVKEGWGGIWKIFTTDSFQGYFGEQKDLIVGARYRPLSIVTFAIEQQLFGESPAVSHFFNVFLYGITALVLFKLFASVFPGKKSDHWYLSIPFITALLFVCHPIHTEVVANIKGRDEIMSLLFALGSVYYALKYVAKQRIIWMLAMCLCFFLGLLSKENALTFLAIVPLTIFVFTRAKFTDYLMTTGPLFVLSILYLLMRSNIIGYLLDSGTEVTDIMNNPFYGLSFSEKFGTIFYTLGHYLKLLLIPHPLTHDYYPFHIPVTGLGDWRALLSMLLNIGLVIVALLGLRKRSVLAYGILFYFITLSIVSNIPFTVGTFMNERFIYVSSVGFCLIAAMLISVWIPRWINEKPGQFNFISVGLLSMLIIGYAAKTITRVPAWKDAMSLNLAAIKVSENSARANLFMGTALFNKYRVETDPRIKNELLTELTPYINKALEINPDYGSAMTMQVGIAAEWFKQDRDIDKLLQEFKTVILKKPGITFVDEYLDYLINGGQYNAQITRWVLEVSNGFQQQLQDNFAMKYLISYGQKIAPDNPRINRDIANLYRKNGNEPKALEYEQKIAQ